MLNIGNKNFMNLQEAVGWLLENNATPFQSTANYAGNTEIAMSTLINPSPAKVRVGSIIFFADSKVSTVIGVTSNSFICSDEYNDLVDDVVYVSNVAQNASGHLIVTLSNGDTIDAGLIKQVSNFSINASQHLIANYNDGTSTDLGAIFTGNINIAGNLTADSIIENMSGYSFTAHTPTNITLTDTYANVVKTGNKITFVLALNMEKSADANNQAIGQFNIPMSIANQLVPFTYNKIDQREVSAVSIDDSTLTDVNIYMAKNNYGNLFVYLRTTTPLTVSTKYFVRYEATFLLGSNMAS